MGSFSNIGRKGRVRDWVSPSFHGGGGGSKDVSTVFYAINEVGKDKYSNCDLDRQLIIVFVLFSFVARRGHFFV